MKLIISGLLPITILCLLVNTDATAQKDKLANKVKIVQQGYAVRGATFIENVPIYNKDEVRTTNDMPAALRFQVHKTGANIVRIYEDVTQKKKKVKRLLRAELYHTNDTAGVTVIPNEIYYDSLVNTLGVKEDEIMIIYFYSPQNEKNDGSAFYTPDVNIEGCFIHKNDVCSYIVKANDSYDYPAKMGAYKPTIIKMKPHNIYFFEVYINKSMAYVNLVSIDRGYRICKYYQEHPDEE